MLPGDAACASCGVDVPPDARFCPNCGTRVTSREEAERRLMTVTFLDLVGSTPIAEGMDPEEFRDLVLIYQQACVEAIEAEDGYVADYRGDAVLAYFGYPHAGEDDAVRAVRASLRAVDRLAGMASELELRAGIHTGLVVVGGMGAGNRRKADVVLGDVPNVAARVQTAAGPSEVVISGETFELLAGRFETDDLGTPELKGITRTIRLYRVRAERAPAGPAELGPLVGRDAELAILGEHFDRAAAGRGALVVIEGEPGVGKSRLVRAFAGRLAGRRHRWIDLVAAPGDRLSPLRPVIASLAEHADLEGPSDDTQLLRSVAGLPARALDLPASLVRRRTLGALVRWLTGLASDGPLVLAVEDAHWLDPTTSELLTGLAGAVGDQRMLVVVTTRGGGIGRAAETIALAPLGAEPAADLVRAVGGADLPDDTVAHVVERADGIPLFVEEMTRAMLEGGGTIPLSLQQSLAARLDRLGKAREVAQVAAVVGRDFDGGLLAAVMDGDRRSVTSGLDALVGSGLLVRTTAAADRAYRFRHALVRDVAYDSLLRARRRDLHGRVAAALETMRPEVARAQPEVLAYHHAEAGDERAAIDHWTRAAQQASDRHGLAEAIEHATRAISGVRALEASPERDRWEIALTMLLMRLIVQTRGSGDARMEALFVRLGELTEASGPDAVDRFLARSGLCAFLIGHGRFGEALVIAREMAESYARTPRRTFRLFAGAWQGIIQYYRGEFAASRDHLRDAVGAYRADRDLATAELYGFDVATNATAHIGYDLWYLGDRDGALASMASAREIGRELPFAFPYCHAVVCTAILHALDADPARAVAAADDAIAMSAEHEWWALKGQAEFAKARGLWQRGDAAAATGLLTGALDALLDEGGFGGATMGLAWLAEAQLDDGRPDEAEATIVRALDMLERTDERFFEAEAGRIHARVLAVTGRADDAEAALRRALDVARGQGNVPAIASVEAQPL